MINKADDPQPGSRAPDPDGGAAAPSRFERAFRVDCLGLAYRARAEEIIIRDPAGRPKASIFTFAYLAGSAGDTDRPLLFAFNGGPGSSAQWLQMGALGPRRLRVPERPEAFGHPPYEIVENELTLLRDADLVFIDPVGTGFSRALNGHEEEQFWRVDEDAASVAAAIEAWLTTNRRWNSPKFVVGESYGTIRACLVADLLGDRHINLDGLGLIAPVLDYRNSRPREGDGGVLSYVGFVPTYAAAAWFHRRIDPGGLDLEPFLDRVRQFAMSDYAHTLIAGKRRQSVPAREQVLAQLSDYIGIDRDCLDRTALRLAPDIFAKQLLRKDDAVIGRLDARYVGTEFVSASERARNDPSFDAVAAAFTAAMHAEIESIGIEVDRPYQAMLPLHERWTWLNGAKPPNGGGYIDVIPQLARAMHRNPNLKVLAALGYYDLATPFFGAENALAREGLPHSRIELRHYPVGHMIFLEADCRAALLDDLRGLVSGSRKSGSDCDDHE